MHLRYHYDIVFRNRAWRTRCGALTAGLRVCACGIVRRQGEAGMAERMLQFTKVSRSMPDKRPAPVRAADFDEIYADFSPEAAHAQASRCSQCGVPFCQQGCPLQNNIPDWLKLAAEGRMEEAWRVSSATNNMPEICGRICPQDRLCEGICTIEQM